MSYFAEPAAENNRQRLVRQEMPKPKKEKKK